MTKFQVRKMVMPFLYIQGRGAIQQLGEQVSIVGKSAFVVGESVALSIAGDRAKLSLTSAGVDIAAWDDTVKECTYAAIDRLVKRGKESGADIVIGVGGGKAVDTAKATAMRMDVPAITVGTQCATNADASAESVVYTEDHEYVDFIRLTRSPFAVIEDTDIIAAAPLRFIVQGMGDALACKFEGEAFAKARKMKRDGPLPPAAALALADTCYKNLLSRGTKAVRKLRNEEHSQEVEEIVETVKLISCLAFENTGTALAHALHNGLTKTREVKGEHGEIVAYATIVQAVYERRPDKEVGAIVEWCEKVGLPTTLSDLGAPSKDSLNLAAEHACNVDPDILNMPRRVRPSELLKAIEKVERGIC